MAINAKIGADLSAFNANIKQGQTILRSLNAEMKATDAEFKATGNSEQYLANKTRTLNSQLQVQKGIADQAKKALKALDDEGVEPTDAAYQKLYIQMMQATAGMNETQAALNGLSTSEQEAAQSADLLTKNVQGIGKKISLEQVIGGIDRITSGMENAAKKALQLGERLWDNIMQSAQWGDDIAMQAMMAQMSVEQYQKVVNVAATQGETSTSSLIKSWKKVKMNLTSDTDDVKDAFKELGIVTKQWGDAGQSGPSLIARDYMDVWWETGEALLKVSDAAKQERLAQTLLGRSWQESLPMFLMGREAYEKALENASAVNEEEVNNLATLNDTVIEVEQKFNALKNSVLGDLAPAFTKVAGSVGGLLEQLNEYMKTEDGQRMLESLGTAVTGLFSDIDKIDPKQVVEGITGVINNVVGSFQWLVENKDTIISVMKGVLIGWGALELTGDILKVVQLIEGIKGLRAAEAGAAGAAAGAAWAKAFAAAVMKAAPWLIGIYIMLNPSGTSDKIGDNTLVDEAGNLTKEAEHYGFVKDENGEIYQDRTQIINEAAQKAWDLYKENQLTAEGMEQLRQTILNDTAYNELINQFWQTRQMNPENWKNIEDIDLAEWLKGLEPPKVPVEPEVPKDAGSKISEDIGTVSVPVVLVPSLGGDSVNNTELRRRNGGGGIPGFANGIRYVSQDNVLALLHKGERVTPAREVSSRSYNSNLYVENMIMGGGMDAAGLAARMAAAQQRQMSGYGS